MDEGIEIRARLHGGSEVKQQIHGVREELGRFVGTTERSNRESRKAGKSYEYAAQRLRLFGHATVGVRERTLGIASAALGASAGIFGAEEVVRRSTEAWGEQRRELAQTQAVLHSTRGAAHVTAEGVERLAGATSRKTGIDKAQINSAENLLLTFRSIRNESGHGRDIFNQTTAAVVDMSTAMHTDLRTSALQVGKALQDPVKGSTTLRRVGVQLSDSQQQQIKTLTQYGDKLGAQRIILRELTKEFGGSAAAVATPGMKLKATVRELEEQFGRGLQPVIDDVDQSLIHLADRAMPALTHFSDDLDRIFKRKGLSLGERLGLSGKAAKADLSPFVDSVEAQLRSAHLGDKLEQAIEFAAPKIAEGAAHAAPKALGAFVNVWLHSDLWGKLLISGYALKRLGLLGTIAGRVFGGGFAAGARGGVAAGEASTVATAAKGAGVGALLARGLGIARYAGPAGAFLAGSGLAGGPFAGKIVGESQEQRMLRLHTAALRGSEAQYYSRNPGNLTAARLDAYGSRAEVHHHHIYIDGHEVAGVLADKHGRVMAGGVKRAADDAKARK